jgi:hypothetical protein
MDWDSIYTDEHPKMVTIGEIELVPKDWSHVEHDLYQYIEHVENDGPIPDKCLTANWGDLINYAIDLAIT